MNSSRPHLEGLRRMYLAAPCNAVFPDLDVALAPGTAEVRFTATPSMFHAGGSLHGAFFFKALDDASYFAAATTDESRFVLTASMNVTLLRVARAGLLRARGTVVRAGKTLVYANAELFDADDGLLAQAQGVFARGPLRLDEVPSYRGEGVPG